MHTAILYTPLDHFVFSQNTQKSSTHIKRYKNYCKKNSIHECKIEKTCQQKRQAMAPLELIYMAF